MSITYSGSWRDDCYATLADKLQKRRGVGLSELIRRLVVDEAHRERMITKTEWKEMAYEARGPRKQ